MIDLRFFEALQNLALEEIADLAGATLSGKNKTKITGLAALAEAQVGDLCFHEGKKSDLEKVEVHASACFVTEEAAEALPEHTVALIVPKPRLGFIAAANALYRLRDWQDEGAEPVIHDTARLGPGVIIGAGAAIGPRVEIGPNVVIGPGVQIGHDTVIGPCASIRCALIGNHVTIMAGARIGEAGFGVTHNQDGALDVPQLARVIIQDHALIGGNTCVDRGALTDTIIGERTKTDNLVQIAHGVTIGWNTLIASQTGISGSVKLGDNVVMGGQVGYAPGIKVGDGAQLAGSAGVLKDVPAGELWGGTPAKPLRQFLREMSWLQRQVANKNKKPDA